MPTDPVAVQDLIQQVLGYGGGGLVGGAGGLWLLLKLVERKNSGGNGKALGKSDEKVVGKLNEILKVSEASRVASEATRVASEATRTATEATRRATETMAGKMDTLSTTMTQIALRG